MNQEESQVVDERAERWKEEDATGKPFKGQAGGLVHLYLQLRKEHILTVCQSSDICPEDTLARHGGTRGS